MEGSKRNETDKDTNLSEHKQRPKKENSNQFNFESKKYSNDKVPEDIKNSTTSSPILNPLNAKIINPISNSPNSNYIPIANNNLSINPNIISNANITNDTDSIRLINDTDNIHLNDTKVKPKEDDINSTTNEFGWEDDADCSPPFCNSPFCNNCREYRTPKCCIECNGNRDLTKPDKCRYCLMISSDAPCPYKNNADFAIHSDDSSCSENISYFQNNPIHDMAAYAQGVDENCYDGDSEDILLSSKISTIETPKLQSEKFPLEFDDTYAQFLELACNFALKEIELPFDDTKTIDRFIKDLEKLNKQ